MDVYTYIFVLCFRPQIHSIVFSKSFTLPVFVKSPLCNNTSPSGTVKECACVSLIQTKRVQSLESGGGGFEISYSTCIMQFEDLMVSGKDMVLDEFY